MALIGQVKLRERMLPCEFAYAVLGGETVYEGGLVALNAAGTLQRIQTAGSVVCAGIADGTRINSPAGNDVRAVRCRKGTWQLNVAGATVANISQTVYATDDATVVLGGLTATVVAGGANYGNGTFTTGPTLGAGAKAGQYLLTFTGATTFTMTDPVGDAMPAGAALAGYADPAMSFSITAGTNAFQAGDIETITVAETGGGLPIGTLAGIDGGLTYVRLSGST
jgi:hypothetical protein